MAAPSSADAAAAEAAAIAKLPTIPLSEVAKHTTPKDAWLAMDGGVYDATLYVDGHPGGPEILMSHAGKDATLEFDGACSNGVWRVTCYALRGVAAA